MLAAWAASPARFREDANAEEDFALGGYRDRLVVELAQNAADAAARAGVEGRLMLTLEGDRLVAANTGAPLDAAGVEALSTLRASAKRDDGQAAGRFGVGFAAVLAVSDEPRIHSTTGAVRWSRAASSVAVDGISSLRDELGRRGGHVPVLRLPFADTGAPPDGYDTAVALPLRDEASHALARRLLDELDATLLLLLPALTEIAVSVDGRRRVLRSTGDGDGVRIDDGDATTCWRVRRDAGRLPPELFADRPVEEAHRPFWSVLWAVPVDADGRPQPVTGLPAVVHAPTPTDEPLSLPALLAASFPLDPSRRHVASGALRDAVVLHAADSYVALAAELPPEPAVLDLVPAGLPLGGLDAALRTAVLDRLADTAFLPAAAGGDVRLRPEEAVVLDDPLLPVLREEIPTLVAAGFSGGRRETALAVLGIRRPTVAEVVDALTAGEREPSWWRRLYAALDAAVPPGGDRDALGALPVPLADGRLVRGPRGLLLPTADLPAAALAPLRLRVVHPEAAHPLLRRLGAVEGSPAAVLGDPQVAAAVEGWWESDEDDDPAPLAEAVLTLVAASGVRPAELPWLGAVPLPGEDGETYPAEELLLADGPLAPLLADDAPLVAVDDELVSRWGTDVLQAVGVAASFVVVRATDVLLDDDSDVGHGLADVEDWLADLLEEHGTGAAVEELVGVRDLDLVDPAAWADALHLLAAPPLRDAVLAPAVVVRADGRRVSVPSYTSWWLRRQRVLDGECPPLWRLRDADPLLAGLYDETDAALDPDFLRGIGVLADLSDAEDALDRLADPARVVTRVQARALYARLATSGSHPPPARVRAVRAGALVVVDAGDAVCVDAPDLLPLVGERAVVPAPARLAVQVADLLDLPLASELGDYPVVSAGRPARHEGHDYVEHELLEVLDVSREPVPVAWRYVDGSLHIDAGQRAFGLGRGLAWVTGEWSRRHLLTAALTDPATLPTLMSEADLE